MSAAVRVTAAVSCGLITAGVVAGASLAMHLGHVWPGVAVGFGVTTLNVLAWTSPGRSR